MSSASKQSCSRSAPALDAIDAALGANVLFATVAETADALDNLDAAVVAEIVSVPGGAYYRPPLRPAPVYGVGYGILPQLEGEAHGTVGTPTGEVDDWPDDVELMLLLALAA